MAHDLNKPAQLKYASAAAEPPLDWSDAEGFALLRDALQVAVDRISDAPWIRTDHGIIKPAEVEVLWKEAFRPLSD